MATILEAQGTLVEDHDFTEFMREEHPEFAEFLMSYYIPASERWVLGTWINESTGEVRELTSWGKYEQPGTEHVQTVEANLRMDVYLRGMRRYLHNMLANRRAKIRQRWDRLREYKNVDKFLKKRVRMETPGDVPAILS